MLEGQWTTILRIFVLTDSSSYAKLFSSNSFPISSAYLLDSQMEDATH